MTGLSAPMSRRALLAGLLGVVPALGAQTQAPVAGGGSTGRLFTPEAAGRPRAPTAPGDANAAIQAIEQKLGCHCGCTLDIFTCRTTDFTCTTSPRLHQEVVALYEGGATAEAILDEFVAKYGEDALMAPKAEGFNLAGYLVPGILIVLLGAVLAWVVGRRFRLATHGSPAVAGPASPPAPLDSDAEERLRRALTEVED
jgi:cytochrome c-type biogenesis protein CcmH